MLVLKVRNHRSLQPQELSILSLMWKPRSISASAASEIGAETTPRSIPMVLFLGAARRAASCSQVSEIVRPGQGPRSRRS